MTPEEEHDYQVTAFAGVGRRPGPGVVGSAAGRHPQRLARPRHPGDVSAPRPALRGTLRPSRARTCRASKPFSDLPPDVRLQPSEDLRPSFMAGARTFTLEAEVRQADRCDASLFLQIKTDN